MPTARHDRKPRVELGGRIPEFIAVVVTLVWAWTVISKSASPWVHFVMLGVTGSIFGFRIVTKGVEID